MRSTRNTRNIQIEHGVPAPEARRGAPATYPFRQLTEVGYAFFVPDPDKKIASMRSLCSWWARPTRWPDGGEREFRCEQVVKNQTAGIRVVRTK